MSTLSGIASCQKDKPHSLLVYAMVFYGILQDFPSDVRVELDSALIGWGRIPAVYGGAGKAQEEGTAPRNSLPSVR